MIIEAILKINPNAIVHVRGDDINTCEIDWLEGTTPISKADIEAKMASCLLLKKKPLKQSQMQLQANRNLKI